MRSRIFFIFLVVLISGGKSHGDNVAKWFMGLRFLRKNCPLVPWKDPGQENFLQTLQSCLQRRVLIAVDAFFDEDIIPIFDGIYLVRLNKTSNPSDRDELNSNEINTGRRNNVSNLWEILTNRISRIFRNRVLKFDIGHLTKLTDLVNYSDLNNVVEGRRRRRKQGMMMMLMMGVMLMGTILIPMGFQFLAVLGGKALLLAKMALMLSSIQGLKRVATSGVNYGLYHSPADAWHERSHLDPSSQIYEIPYQPYPHIERRH